MRTLDTRCGRLIKNVKSRLADRSVVFVHAFSADKIQNPPEKYLVSVSAGEAGTEGFVADQNGGIVRAALTCRVFAPRGADGEALNSLCLSLAEATRSAGKEIVDTVSISETRYDSKARTVYRTVRARLSYPKEVDP